MKQPKQLRKAWSPTPIRLSSRPSPRPGGKAAKIAKYKRPLPKLPTKRINRHRKIIMMKQGYVYDKRRN